MRYIFWFITIYLLYRLVFNFIIPVWRVSRQMKGQMRDFQNHMNSQGPGMQQTETPKPAQSATSTKSGKGDYIDFEEVK